MIKYNLSNNLQNTLKDINNVELVDISDFIKKLLSTNNSNYKIQYSEYIDWINSAEFMYTQISGINEFVLRTKSFEKFIFVGMGASSIIPRLMSNDDKRLLFIDGSDSCLYDELFSNPQNNLIFFVSKTGATLETQTIMNNYIKYISEHCPDFQYSDNLIAITDHGSELYDFAVKNNFREVFSNLPNMPGRFSPISFTGLIPAAISGINIKKLLNNITEYKKQLITNDLKRKNLVKLITLIYKLANNKLNIFRLYSPDKKNDSKIIWLQQMIAESLSKNPNYVIPILAEHNSYLDTKSIINFVFTNKNTHVPCNLSNTISIDDSRPGSEDFGSLIYSIMIIICSLSFIDGNNNPYTQPDVEKAKNPKYLETSITTSENHNDISKSKISYISFLLFINNKKEIKDSIKIILSKMKNLDIPIFIDIAPSYLHTTGELHKKNYGALHFLIYSDSLNINNLDNLNLSNILKKQINAEISILKESNLNFQLVNSNNLTKIINKHFKGFN
tara:strand:- start:583 stop:2094 length:1512 start_codon:yes stop_codon:yes gene_type:complete